MSRILIRFRPGVQGRLVGDEVTLVSFRNGRYYTAKNTLAVVTEALSRGMIDGSNPGTDLEHALAALRKEDLVEDFSTEAEPVFLNPDLGIALGVSELEVGSEFKDILTLDPIHDVGPEGWPERAR